MPLKFARRFAAFILSLSLILVSPGLAGYEAAAAVIRTGSFGKVSAQGGSGANSGALKLNVNLGSGNALNLGGNAFKPVTLNLPAPSVVLDNGAQARKETVSGAPAGQEIVSGGLSAQQDAVTGAVVPGVAAGLPASGIQTLGSNSEAAALNGLTTKVGELKKTGSLDGRRTLLDRIFGRNSGSGEVSGVVSGKEPAGKGGSLSLSGKAGSGDKALSAGSNNSSSNNGANVPPPSNNNGGSSGEDFTPEQRRAVFGMTWSRFFSLLSFSISQIAYPLMVIAAVGKQEMLDIYALGGLSSIVLTLVAGKIGDMMPLKKYTIFNIVLRSAINLATAVLFVTGGLSFWPLLALSILSSWQFATLFVNDYALMAQIVGKNKNKLRSTEALIRMTTIVVTVLAGLFLGKPMINMFGYFWTFAIVAAIQLIPAFIMARTLPNIGKTGSGPALTWSLIKETVKAKLASLRGLGRQTAGKLAERDNVKKIVAGLLIAGALALFFVPIPFAPFLFKSPIPFILVAGFLLLRSDAYRNVISKHRLFKFSLFFVMIGAFVELPMRNSVLGILANETMTDPGEAAKYLGSLVAAFYLGQMPSGTGMLDKTLGFKVLGKDVNLRNVMKWVGALGIAAWTNFILLPAGWLSGLAGAAVSISPLALDILAGGLVSAATIAAYIYFHNASPKLTDQAWMKWEAFALAFMALPLLFWGAPWALYLSLAVFGFVLNGSQRMISATFSQQAQEHAGTQFQYINGIRGSFFNMSTAVAYALYSVAGSLPKTWWGQSESFPFLWYVIAGTYLAFGALFLYGSRIFKSDKPKP